MILRDLRNRFEYHRPDDVTGARHDLVREACLKLAVTLDELLEEGREKNQAITRLEEAMFWANAAIARVTSAGIRV